MADTSVKLSGTYDSIEAYNIMVEMQNMSADYEEIRTEAAAAASAATAAVTTAQTAANSASTYAGNAQTYAGNANTSAGEAAGYASDASTAATNAASSETNAHNSEVAAAASASSAAASEAVVAGALPLSGGTMTGDIEFYDDLFLGTPPDGVDPSQKSTFNGLYENKNDPHKYGGVAFHQATDDPSYRTQLVLDAGDGTNQNWFTIYGDAEGGIKYNGSSLTDGTFLTMRKVTYNLPATISGSLGPIVAPTVNGYQFICWVQIVSNGAVFPVYADAVMSTSSAIWIPSTFYSTANGKRVDGFALYIRKW